MWLDSVPDAEGKRMSRLDSIPASSSVGSHAGRRMMKTCAAMRVGGVRRASSQGQGRLLDAKTEGGRMVQVEMVCA